MNATLTIILTLVIIFWNLGVGEIYVITPKFVNNAIAYCFFLSLAS